MLYRLLLADTTQCDTENQNQKTNRNVNVFANWEEQPAKRLFTAGVDLLFYIFFAEDPEEHNACQTCTKRADVNGQYIHPVGDNALDQHETTMPMAAITRQDAFLPRPVFS